MSGDMLLMLVLAAVSMVLARAFPLTAGSMGVRPERVEAVVVYPQSLLMVALSMQAGGVILTWMLHEFGFMAGQRPAAVAMTALLMAGAAVICLAVGRFAAVACDGKVSVRPVMGRRYEFAVSDIAALSLGDSGRGMARICLSDGRRLRLHSMMPGYQQLIAALNSAAVKQAQQDDGDDVRA